MKTELAGSYYIVTAEPEDIAAFMASWPCSGLDPDCSYRFEFSASNGDLVDLQAYREGNPVEHEDGEALAALSEDAGRFGANRLGLDKVMAIRWPEAASLPTP